MTLLPASLLHQALWSLINLEVVDLVNTRKQRETEIRVHLFASESRMLLS